MPPILYLIDGHALAYRTYFALTASGGESFKTRSGEPTAGVFGFASVLLRLLEQDQPEYLGVAFDTGKTFRDDLFPQYKATRAKMPDDLRIQMERIRQMVDAFHFPRLEMEGFEADDVLGSIALQAVAKGLGVKIITGDRDLLQLVNQRIIVNLAGSKLSEARDFTPQDVISYLGVRPEQVIEYKGLVGDPSDNIPGVHGVGEKTATSLLAQFNTLEDIYAHLDELPGRVKTRLEDGRDMAFLSRNLATIRTDLRLLFNLDNARTDHINFQAVEALFQELEFRTLLRRLHDLPQSAARGARGQQLNLFETRPATVGEAPFYQPEVIVVDTPDELQKLQTRLEKANQISLDTETTSTDPLRADLVGISLAIRPGEGYYIPIGHRAATRQLPIQQVLEALRPALTNQYKQKIGHNLKFDALVLIQHGLRPGPLTFDTMIAEWLVDPGSRNLGLKNMAEYYLGIAMAHIEELIGKGKNQRSMAEVPVEKTAPYAAADAEVVLQLVPILQSQMEEHNAVGLFHELEMPLLPILADMELTGIVLDQPFFSQMSTELATRMREIEDQIFGAVGRPFNINSTQQLSKVLFETLHLEPPDRGKRTASGHFSTSVDVLEELQGKHLVVDMVLEYRELAKLKSTYVDALPLQINPRTGRVHTSYNQTGSVTGRLASSEPNLQNIPTRTELGRRVREGFIAAPGTSLLSIDYSQIELRIVAHMSGDEAMLAAFRAGEDIHTTTAAAIYGISRDQVTKEQRRHSKAINFGLIYGMSAFGLRRTTDLTLAESEDFVTAYFHQFPGVKHYLDGIRRLAAEQGYVETILGRRRYFPNLRNQANINLKNREEREAINAPIQGTAADIIKLAMIRLPAALNQAGLKTRLLLQVHDELVLEAPLSELLEAAALVKNVMENALPLSIPLLTEARWGANWSQLQPLSTFSS